MEFLNNVGLYGEGSATALSSSDAFRKFSELVQNKPYRLSRVELINTKFGKKLALRLVDEAGIFFLPSRFQNHSQEKKSEMVRTLKESSDVTIFYRGERTFGAYQNSTPLIQFSLFHPTSSSSSAVDVGVAAAAASAVVLEGKRERAEQEQEEESVEPKPKKKKKKNHDS